ncbi:MAG: hypothetical protein AAFS04_17700 [Cyanobacteria bacterium J06631_9]
MNEFFSRFGSGIRQSLALVCLVAVLTLGMFEQRALAQPFQDAIAQPIVAYNIDFGMDLARVEQTIEHYGEEIREVVEQALRNNVNNPESKETAQNTYQRESALNDVLPEKRSSAFSKDDLTNLRNTKHPRDILK